LTKNRWTIGVLEKHPESGRSVYDLKGVTPGAGEVLRGYGDGIFGNLLLRVIYVKIQ
jgi:hypothetical protein